MRRLWLALGLQWLAVALGAPNLIDFIGVAPAPNVAAEIPGLRNSVQDNVYLEFAEASILATPLSLLSDEGYSKQCFPLQIDLDRFMAKDICRLLNATRCPLSPPQFLEAHNTLKAYRDQTISHLLDAKAIVKKQQDLLRSFGEGGQQNATLGLRGRKRRFVDPVAVGSILWDVANLGTSEAALTLIGVNRDAIHDLYSQALPLRRLLQAAEQSRELTRREDDQTELVSISQEVADAVKSLASEVHSVSKRLDILKMGQELNVKLQQDASEIRMGIDAAVIRGEVTPGLISSEDLMQQLRQSYGDIGLRGMLFRDYPELIYKLSRIIVVGSYPKLQRLLGLVCVPMIHRDRLFILFRHIHAGAFTKDMKFFGRAKIPSFSVLPQHAWSLKSIRYPDIGSCWNDQHFLRLCPPIPRTINGSHATCSIPPGPGCHWELTKVEGEFAQGILMGDKWLIATNLKFYREEVPRPRHGGLLSPEGSIVKPVERPVNLYFIPAGGFLHFGKETFGGVPRASNHNAEFRRKILIVTDSGRRKSVLEEIADVVSTDSNMTHVVLDVKSFNPADGSEAGFQFPEFATGKKSEGGQTYFIWGLGGLSLVNAIFLVSLWVLYYRHQADLDKHSVRSLSPKRTLPRVDSFAERTTVGRSAEHIPAAAHVSHDYRQDEGIGHSLGSREPSIEYILAPIPANMSAEHLNSIDRRSRRSPEPRSRTPPRRERSRSREEAVEPRELSPLPPRHRRENRIASTREPRELRDSGASWSR